MQAPTSGSSCFDGQQLAEALHERRAKVGQQLPVVRAGSSTCSSAKRMHVRKNGSGVHQAAIEVEDHRAPHGA